MTDQPLLQVRDLRVGFAAGSADLLKGIDLDLRAGEILGLVGSSGSGKSLLARALIGLLPAGARIRGGERRYRGELINDRNGARWRGGEIAYVFQDAASSLHPLRRVGTQMREALRVHAPQLRGAALQQRIAAAVEEVGLAAEPRWLRAFPHQLSGGQRQRVMLALTLLPQPAVLIADEPTSALDPVLARRVCDLLAATARGRGMALLLISHDLPRVAEYGGRVLQIDDGTIRPAGDWTDPAGRGLSQVLADSRCGTNVATLEPAAAAMEAQQLSLGYGRRSWWPWRRPPVLAVDRVDLVLTPGQRLAVIGGSGSGKSTLARGLLGLLPAAGGSVSWFGRALAGLSRSDLRHWRPRIQLVFQDPFRSLDPLQRVDQMLFEALGFARQPLPARERLAAATAALADVGLDATALQRYPNQFSGGQRQRLALARALACGPEVLICDEATSALDHATQAQILDLLEGLAQARALTLMFVAHDLVAVARLCDSMIVLDAGRVVEAGSTRDLLRAPASAALRGLVAALPLVGPARPRAIAEGHGDGREA
jgi:peptide/nickel transport system ATP-binding protein